MSRPRIYPAGQPTRKVHVCLPADVHSTLMQLSDVLEMPAARFVALFLMDNHDALKQLVEVCSKAKEARELAPLRQVLEDRARMAQQLAELIPNP